jgi:hypothetical protein
LNRSSKTIFLRDEAFHDFVYQLIRAPAGLAGHVGELCFLIGG